MNDFKSIFLKMITCIVITNENVLVVDNNLYVNISKTMKIFIVYSFL